MMKNKMLVVGALAVALVTGGVIGASTLDIGQAKENDHTPTVMTQPAEKVKASASAKTNTHANEVPTNKQADLLTVDEVVAIALQHADGRVESVELERERGQRYYEIEIENRTTEYELDIDAYTGEVLKIEKETRHDRKDDARKENKRVQQAETTPKANNDSNKMLTISEAIAIATAKAPGKVEEAELDRDDGVTYYEIEIETANGEVEIEVHAYTGQILSVEYED